MENPNLNACNFPQIGTIPTQKTLFIFLKTNWTQFRVGQRHNMKDINKILQSILLSVYVYTRLYSGLWDDKPSKNVFLK